MFCRTGGEKNRKCLKNLIMRHYPALESCLRASRLLAPGGSMLPHQPVGLMATMITDIGKSVTVADGFQQPSPKTAPAFTREDPREAGGARGAISEPSF